MPLKATEGAFVLEWTRSWSSVECIDVGSISIIIAKRLITKGKGTQGTRPKNQEEVQETCRTLDMEARSEPGQIRIKVGRATTVHSSTPLFFSFPLPTSGAPPGLAAFLSSRFPLLHSFLFLHPTPFLLDPC